jgi:hypothetical protein
MYVDETMRASAAPIRRCWWLVTGLALLAVFMTGSA